MGLTELQLRKLRKRGSTWWDSETFGLDLQAFQVIVERVQQLEATGALRIVDAHKETVRGERFCDKVRVQRLK